MTKQSLAVAVTLLVAVAASAHDTWVQTNTNVLRGSDPGSAHGYVWLFRRK